MIIDDTHRLVFVHIPKCAGTSVRRALRPFDESKAFEGFGTHAVLGHYHRAHIPLAALAAHFPDTFQKVRDYDAFAILRDPMARFLSAIFQRLREFKGVAQSDFTPALIEREAAAVRAVLIASPGHLEAEWVHFTRQCDFVEHEGRRVVEALFTVRDMAAVSRFIAARTGLALGEEKRNRTTVLSLGALKPVQRLLRQPYARTFSPDRRKAVREWMERAGLYKDIPKQDFALGTEMTAFVRAHYRRDFELLAELAEAPAPSVGTESVHAR